MKVLMLAAACSPYSGSEPYVGWLWANAAAQKHEVWLVVASWCIPFLSKARDEGLIPPNLHIVDVGSTRRMPPRGKFATRAFCWYQHASFNRASRSVISGLVKEIPFDVAHQTTIATWRLGSPLADFNLPYVWGPLGGGERIPLNYFKDMTPGGMLFELTRIFARKVGIISPGNRRSAQRAAVVIATNRENDELLRQLGRKGPILQCPMLISREKFNILSSLDRTEPENGTFQLFTGGGLHAAKGVALALRTIQCLKRRGYSVRLVVGGHGSELSQLMRLSYKWGISSDVDFQPGLGGNDYYKTLCSSHALLLPSLRDNTSLTLVEAMAAGTIPIVLDHSGPGEVVAPGCGLKVPCGRLEQTVQFLSDAVCQVIHNGAEIDEIRQNARRRILENYLEDRADRTINEAYALAVNG